MIYFIHYARLSLLFFILFAALTTATAVFPCTRILKAGFNQAVMVGRTMDWGLVEMKTNLRVYPQGIHREGSKLVNPLKWTSKYGSIVATAYENITTDGMNDRGLAANLLWLDETNYGVRNEQLPGLSVLMWAQFYLDNFQTVNEAVRFTETTSFQMLAFRHPVFKKWVRVHLSLEDASGDSAIIEYINGRPHIYHHRSYTVLTNSPTYDQQLKNLPEYRAMSDDHPLPGSTNSVDRFIRAAFYVHRLPESSPANDELAELRSVIHNVAEPYGVSSPERDDISPTIWSCIADLSHRIYYFNESKSLNTFWVELDRFNLRQGAPIMHLDSAEMNGLAGEVSEKFTVEMINNQ